MSININLHQKDLPDEFLQIFIVDSNFKPIGTVSSSNEVSSLKVNNFFSLSNHLLKALKNEFLLNIFYIAKLRVLYLLVCFDIQI